ncbi:MAG: methylated-DNA--[protein]-cysteine S-methyltransferase [Candidatus Cloacimonetes bacterium]|jgi:methylated-DNA-[protein]-cysteine S-methyltransferase|nr:methylated-DNA--[protein]-cysteine S-methyltransferase [Candidatus Cloacimonadota bacterium]
MFSVIYYQNPNICLEIGIEDETIMELSFCEKPLNKQKPDAFGETLFKQLDDYFAGKLKEFDIPFFATGTPFQLMVWEELLRLDYGEVITYSELARRIDRPKAARAVGNALGQNPIGIIIPCHRVVRAGGNLGGFGGGLKVKEYLLKLEEENK